MVEMMVEMMVADGALTVESWWGTGWADAHGELCLGRRGGGKQELGPPATTLGSASPRDCSGHKPCSPPVPGLRLVRG